MFVKGCDCSIVIKTSHLEKDIPYSDETLRVAVSILPGRSKRNSKLAAGRDCELEAGTIKTAKGCIVRY